MYLSVFIKESSEHSAANNWAKQQLEESPFVYLDSIEGYTVNLEKGVIMLMDRAKVKYSEISQHTSDEIISDIKLHDGKDDSIQRKIALAKMFGVKFRYLLYSEDKHHVWVYIFENDGAGSLEKEFDSYRNFGIWLEAHRSLDISKDYGHKDVSFETSQFDDLPGFDQTLRKNKTPWLANLDGFISDKKGHPIALLEFQNSSKSPRFHCNNFFYLSGEDKNRFMTLEVARVQSRLPLFIIVWSEKYSDYCIKRVDQCTIADFSDKKEQENLEKRLLYSYFPSKKSKDIYEKICASINTFSLDYDRNAIVKKEHSPLLSINAKTFPLIYYSHKQYFNNKSSFKSNFLSHLHICPLCGSELKLRKGSFGEFWGCSSYPNCKHTSNIPNMTVDKNGSGRNN